MLDVQAERGIIVYLQKKLNKLKHRLLGLQQLPCPYYRLNEGYSRVVKNLLLIMSSVF